MAKDPATQSPSPADRLRAAADNLDSFASVAPLVFAVAEGDKLLCVNSFESSLSGPTGPEPHEALNRFYAAIMEIDQLLKDLGCEDRDGQPLSEIVVMAWSKWLCLNPAKRWPPRTVDILTLGKSLVRWWETNRGQVGLESKHPWCTWIEASSPEFAKRASAEARVIAGSMPLRPKPSVAVLDDWSPEDIRSSTPSLNPGSPEWMTLKECQKATGLRVGTLGSHRRTGWTDEDGMLGRDKCGRVWRRKGTSLSHAFYFRPTVELSTAKRGKSTKNSA